MWRSRLPTRMRVNTVHNTGDRNIQARHRASQRSSPADCPLLSLPQIPFAGNSSPLHPGTRIPWSSHPGFRQSRADVRRPTSHKQNRHDATLHGGWPGCHGCRRREIKNLIPTSPVRFRLDGIGPTGLGPDIGCQRGVGTRDGSLLEGETGSAWLVRLGGGRVWRCYVLLDMMGVAADYF